MLIFQTRRITTDAPLRIYFIYQKNRFTYRNAMSFDTVATHVDKNLSSAGIFPQRIFLSNLIKNH